MATVVTSKLEQGHLEVTILGRFDFSILNDFKALYFLPNASTISAVTIDLKRSEHMDSSGMGLLLSLKKELQLDPGTIEVKNCRPHIVAALLAARLDHFFKVTPA